MTSPSPKPLSITEADSDEEKIIMTLFKIMCKINYLRPTMSTEVFNSICTACFFYKENLVFWLDY